MLNPYEVRPIGSKKFEQHILDVETSLHYENQLNFKEDDLVKLAETGEYIWKSAEPIDPMEKLATAVTVQAVVDYADCWKEWWTAKSKDNLKGEVYWHSRMLDLENYFFRKWDITETVFERLLDVLEEERITHSARYSARGVVGRVLRNYENYKY